MSKSTKDYNKINWSEHFYVDSSSPSGLLWNRDVYSGTGKMYIKYKKGEPVGSVLLKINKSPQAWRTKIDGISYFIHRIIWCLVNGYIDNSMVVDHINGDPLDNSLENLRLVTTQVNLQNRRMNTLNKSGIGGVCSYMNKGVLTWAATWRKPDGKHAIKTFSTKKYGPEEAFRLACEYRTAQIALLNENGANYTLRHGSA